MRRSREESDGIRRSSDRNRRKSPDSRSPRLHSRSHRRRSSPSNSPVNTRRTSSSPPRRHYRNELTGRVRSPRRRSRSPDGRLRSRRRESVSPERGRDRSRRSDSPDVRRVRKKSLSPASHRRRRESSSPDKKIIQTSLELEKGPEKSERKKVSTSRADRSPVSENEAAEDQHRLSEALQNTEDIAERLDASGEIVPGPESNGDDPSEKGLKKVEPSFGLSGKLAEETNRVKGVTLLFVEPPEARKPSVRWRLYVFKDGEPLNDPLYVHRQSCYLFGRERRVADVPTDHPSCSKQHAVLQYRLVQQEEELGNKSVIRPYIMDLGSTNGTFLNGERIEAQRYYQLLEKDTLKFGNSSREYVLLHENSAA